MKNILVTGGAGFIGSHTCVELLLKDYNVIVVDNLINSKQESLRRIEQITKKTIKFYKVDLRQKDKLNEIFSNNSIDAVIHFAGLKAVGESVLIPIKYYYNNITGTLVLLDAMMHHNVKNIVFSSTAAVYGDSESFPIYESFPVSPTNPYGHTKLMTEQILQDLYQSDPNWEITILRYFNPVGAHPSGLIGEDPNDIPNNLFPYIQQVASGKLDKLLVFGNDYKTSDGTGIRDYIHVVDLAKGHIKALEKLKKGQGIEIYNLGTGIGYSVLESVKNFEKVCGKKIAYKFVGRRKGDIAINYADATKAKEKLGWQAKYDIEQICIDAWNWQSKNPNGY